MKKKEQSLNAGAITSSLKAIDSFSDPIKKIGERLACVNSVKRKAGDIPADVPVLILTRETMPEKIYRLTKGPIRVGRTEDAGIFLDGALVSRDHCFLREDEDEWIVEDNKSTNGLFVNGVKRSLKILCDGDIIRIGHFELIFIKSKKNSENFF
jgi:pSer/pThr/pTyr-binding forkhead associated (FHA) protein